MKQYAIYVRYHYHPETTNIPKNHRYKSGNYNPGISTLGNYPDWTGSRKEALRFINHFNQGEYRLGHGEYARPTLTLVPVIG